MINMTLDEAIEHCKDVNLIGEDIKVELDRSCSKNSKAISIYTD